ncbi:MAG: YdcH family protein [Bdellovibrionota bacterium]|jgi:uncharacterized protein YdcH (DUF465 family)
METVDKELILKFMLHDSTLERLYREHNVLESMLDQFTSRAFLTSEEQLEVQRLKKRKLVGVDKMMSILSRYRETAAMI